MEWDKWQPIIPLKVNIGIVNVDFWFASNLYFRLFLYKTCLLIKKSGANQILFPMNSKCFRFKISEILPRLVQKFGLLRKSYLLCSTNRLAGWMLMDLQLWNVWGQKCEGRITCHCAMWICNKIQWTSDFSPENPRNKYKLF